MSLIWIFDCDARNLAGGVLGLLLRLLGGSVSILGVPSYVQLAFLKAIDLVTNIDNEF